MRFERRRGAGPATGRHYVIPATRVSMSKPDATAGDWAKSVAAMAADSLLDYGLVTKEHFELACDVIAEELYVQLCNNHYPPAVDHSNGDDEELLKLRRG